MIAFLPGNLWFIIKILPLLALTAVLFGLFGWWLRRKFHAPVVSSSKPQVRDDLPARERVKKLENALAKARNAAAHTGLPTPTPMPGARALGVRRGLLNLFA